MAKREKIQYTVRAIFNGEYKTMEEMQEIMAKAPPIIIRYSPEGKLIGFGK